MLQTLVFYWRALFFFWRNGKYQDFSLSFSDTQPSIRAHLFSLALIWDMWSMPHYRAPSLKQDLLNNLKNVALPGTGVPLSWFCCNKLMTYWFILFGLPLVCIFAALRDSSQKAPASTLFEKYLLHPSDWFSLWQLNCRLASLHSLTTSTPGFALENKWDFLVKADAMGVAVSPFIKAESLVLKNKNMEGGMGIHFFKNALAGGDWIIQPAFSNSAEISSVLPPDAPLSTFRVITTSRGALAPEEVCQSKEALPESLISALSCVFRAGRAGAATDHEAVMYDVDGTTGKVLAGGLNEHWYRLGAQHCRPSKSNFPENSTGAARFKSHPDCGKTIVGATVMDPDTVFGICVEAHLKTMPDVPIAGWDVAVTTEGVFLLEANLSCNFFMGTFDQDKYFSFVDDCFLYLDNRRRSTTAAQ